MPIEVGLSLSDTQNDTFLQSHLPFNFFFAFWSAFDCVMYCFYLRLGHLLVVSSIVDLVPIKKWSCQAIRFYKVYTDGGSGVPLYGTLIDLLVLMNPCLGVLLIGALQPYLDYVVADFHWSAAV